MTEDEYGFLKLKAEKCGVTPSEFIRRVVLEKRLLYRRALIHNDERITEALNNVSKVGGLLNQIARYYNSGGVETEQIRKDIQEAVNAVRSACMKLTKEIEVEYGRT